MKTDTDIGTDEQPLIHGDMLDAILSHVPLIHLIPASHVSKTWSASVSFASRKSMPKPWLILHTQRYRHQYQYPYPTTTHAYDPDSSSWIQIHSPPTNHISTLRSSHSNLLYTLSPTHLSFSFDPLHLTWHHASPPKVSRIDPIVAVVGRRVVVAGGAFDFEDDPLAVELYDLHSHHWTKSDPLPEFFNQSNSSLWLSVASNDPHLFIMEKSSGITYSFDTNNNNWYGPYDLRPDRRVFSSLIGLLNNKLIVVGILGEDEHVEGVKVWEVDNNNINNSFEWNMIGEMPESYVEDMKSCDDDDDDVNIITLIDVVMTGNVVYMCFSLGVEVVNIIVCEVVEGGGCRWRRVVNTAVDCGGGMEKVVVTCSMVGMDELERAGRLENRRFVVKR